MNNALIKEKRELTQVVQEVQEDLTKFDLLYELIVKRVYYWCFSILGNDFDAHDTTQEAMIQIYQGLDALQEPEAFSSWLYQLVRNVCYKHIRDYRKDKDYEFIVDESFKDDFEAKIVEQRTEFQPHEIYDIEETKKIVASFIAKLPQRQREVITLYYLEEFKIDEISEILNYNSGSVKSRLHSGRKNLEALMSEYQNTNNIKLYTISLFPLLGLILREQRDQLFNQSTVNKTTFSKQIVGSQTAKSMISSFIGSVWSKVFLVCLTLTLGGVTVFTLSQFNNREDLSNPKEFYFEDGNLKVNPYISDIIYSSFPTKDHVDVEIILKQDIDQSEISIQFDENNLSFTTQGKGVFLEAKQNGIYTIQIKDRITSFHIKQIDPDAPTLEKVLYHNEYIEFIIRDVEHTIDYTKSYMNYNNERISLAYGLKLLGKFHGNIDIVLYDKNNNYIIYTVNLDDLE